MYQTLEESLDKHIFPDEGGYTNHPADPGGPTNWGITIGDARTYWRPNATADDVRRMPKQVAYDIYRKRYADVLQYDQLPAGVDYAILDYGINSGVSRAAKVLQQILKIGVDGKIGLVTLQATAKADRIWLINAIYNERTSFLKSLKTFGVFGAGWMSRVTRGRKFALELAARYPIEPQPQVPIPEAAPALPDPEPEKSGKALPEPTEVKPIPKSKTVWGGILAWLGGIGGSLVGMFQYIATPWGFAALVFLVLVISIGTYLVIKGRIDVQKVVEKLSEDTNGD